MATTKVIGNIGDRLDLRIRQGADFGPVRSTIHNPDGTPMDLTGCIVRGMVKKKPSDTVPAATFEASITDALAGKFAFWLPNTVTYTLKAGAKIDSPESAYVWDFEMVDSLGRVLPVFYGDALVQREVTRP